MVLMSASQTTTKALWIPSPERVAKTQMMAFCRFLQTTQRVSVTTSDELRTWALQKREAFWDALWDFAGVIGEKGACPLRTGANMLEDQFFPDARLNYAENLLRSSGKQRAVVSYSEGKRRVKWSADALREEVAALQSWFRAQGLKEGDRVAAMVPNIAETLALMLAVTSLGAVWSSCSPDFGVQGVLDRFGQIEPTFFIACDGVWYNHKPVRMLEKLPAIVAGLPTIRKTLVIDHLGEAELVAQSLPNAISVQQAKLAQDTQPLVFTRVPFQAPLFILYSSGTTGIPKCIVHGVGGTLLQHMKEHLLHCDAQPQDRVFYYSTCGWMMWNWLVSALSVEASLVLYDGSPFAPRIDSLFKMAEREKVTFFGTSAKYIDACKKRHVSPAQSYDLSSLRAVASTGSPLAADSFDYVYSTWGADLHLASISGGTDIVSCFVLGDPTKPVFRGQIQDAGLAMDVVIWDEHGKSLLTGKGELVCQQSFPSMPIFFWNDPEGKKYRSAYFERFPGVWCHGDFAEWTPEGGMIIHGRSDATLNPGGVRIGTAEIYAQVEKIPDVLEALCIGQDWDDDVRVVLFVRLKEGVLLDDALKETIKKTIRAGASPRHVPAKIIAVSDIPRTKSGKIVELAVRDVVHGRAVKNQDALANPEALALFTELPDLAC